MADVLVFDGNTLDPVAQADIRQSGGNRIITGDFIVDLARQGCPPESPLTRDFAVDSWDQFQPARLAFLQGEYTRMLRESVDPTLRRLKLIN